jgi:DNA polymerase-3 subunit epsilon
MSWAAQQMLVFDLETTGVNTDLDRVVTAHAAILEGDTTRYAKSWLVSPAIDIDPAASAVNGISTEYARTHGQTDAEAVREIVGALQFATRSNMPIVAYNAAFDLTIMDRECRRHLGGGLADILGRDPSPVVDPFVVWKEVDPYRRGGRKLVDAAAEFGVELVDAHTADADAAAAGRIAQCIARSWSRIGGMGLADLHAAQVVWRANQCDSLRAYFDRQGTAHDGVPGAWPVIPFTAVAQPSLEARS